MNHEETVTTDGRSGDAYLADLSKKGFLLNSVARTILSGYKFPEISEVVHRLIFVKGDEFNNDVRITRNIMAHGIRCGFFNPPIETALLLREKFSTKEMLVPLGLTSLVVMHNPVEVSPGNFNLLHIASHGKKELLYAHRYNPDGWWHQDRGFVFMVP